MISGVDIFTAAKYKCTFKPGSTADAPICNTTEYTLINIEDDGFATLMDENGDIKEDLKLPEDAWL